MKKRTIIALTSVVILVIVGVVLYPTVFPPKQERKILYWTDPMLPGDRSDHPGKSPMGMERTPVYEDEHPAAGIQSDTSVEEYYTCPMHPSVRKSSPGACPVCGMSLVKRSSGAELSDGESRSLGTVTISPSKQVLANVATSVAKKMKLSKSIHAVGKINYAEPNFRQISTRFPGRLDKLYLTFTGQKVLKGDPVADVYSPEVISAQQEYLLAKDSHEQVKDASEMIASSAQSLLDQSKQKLLLWGISEEQIRQLEETKQVKNVLTISSPIGGTVLKKNVDPQHYAAAGEDLYDVADLSTVWMYLDVYEFEIQLLKIGQTVEATSPAYSGEVFRGKISFISPTVEPSSRTVQVRVDVPNPKEYLKPEMFVDATVNVELPATIAVPKTAVIGTGQRQVVWVQKQSGVFEPRVVTVGQSSQEFVQIVSGIHEGETVVSSGGYLIDSESQLQTTSGASSEHAGMNMDTKTK